MLIAPLRGMPAQGVLPGLHIAACSADMLSSCFLFMFRLARRHGSCAFCYGESRVFVGNRYSRIFSLLWLLAAVCAIEGGCRCRQKAVFRVVKGCVLCRKRPCSTPLTAAFYSGKGRDPDSRQPDFALNIGVLQCIRCNYACLQVWFAKVNDTFRYVIMTLFYKKHMAFCSFFIYEPL